MHDGTDFWERTDFCLRPGERNPGGSMSVVVVAYATIAVATNGIAKKVSKVLDSAKLGKGLICSNKFTYY
jgi:hypothetical protein